MLDFEENDKEYLQILPKKGVVRFGKKGNFRPLYVGINEILKRVFNIEYELKNP